MAKRKTPVHFTLDDDVYEDFRQSLIKTKYRGNASAAIREYVLSASQERRKSASFSQSDDQDKSAVSSVSSYNKSDRMTLDKLNMDWIVDCENWDRQNKIQDSLSEHDQRRLAIALDKTAKRWKSRLPKLVFKYADNSKSGLQTDRNAQYTTLQENCTEEIIKQEVIH